MRGDLLRPTRSKPGTLLVLYISNLFRCSYDKKKMRKVAAILDAILDLDI